MSQHAWAYLSPGGQQYIVGLYHGPDSGNLVVYCNNEVVAIDFQVKDQARYSFFIEEDLCEVRIEKKGDHFQYFFESNLEVDTPLNRKRQQAARRDKRFLIFILIASVVLAAVLVSFTMYTLGKAREKARIELAEDRYGVETEAIILSDKNKNGKHHITFSYQTHNQQRRGKIEIAPESFFPNGMPIESGDVFTAFYHVLRPEVHRVDFSKPTIEQQKRYRERARNQHLQLHRGISPAETDSLLDIAFKKFGAEAWPIFYWQNAEPEENPEYNRVRFEEARRLMLR